MKSDPNSLLISVIKSPQYRQIHVDGTMFSLTPGGYANLAFYGERAALPQRIRYKLEEDGQLGEKVEMEIEEDSDVIHEVEFSVILDLDSLKQLKEGIDLLIKELEDED